MIKALGAKLLDKNGNDVGNGGGSLDKIDVIDLSDMYERIKNCNIVAACDVDNPLVGLRGASHVFGPQKGADPEMVKVLDKNLEHYTDVVLKATGISIGDFPGAGAAGGLGEGMMDYQTQYGKTPYGVAQVAKKNNIPVIAIVGSVGRNAEVLYDLGFSGIFSIINRPMTLQEAISDSAEILEQTSENIMRMVKACML